MKTWLVSKAYKYEGAYPQGILSDEGLAKYLEDKPGFQADAYGGYTTYQPGNYEWLDIEPWEVDSLIEG